jgi:hypothetical protein
MKKFLVTLAVMGFGLAAHAEGLEIQISNSFIGTGANVTISDEDNADATSFGINAQVYKSLTDTFQIGGGLTVADSGQDGSDTVFGVALLGRYNFDSELRNAMFAGAGVSYTDFGPGDTIKLHLEFGKRYALSDTITWTPNLAVIMDMAGDDDEGMDIVLNLISFSGMM